ncbi:GrpB family protein [Bacillus sp. NSP9.1]|nr:GrpB family protein [Bacillus sp. NSP9.1]
MKKDLARRFPYTSYTKGKEPFIRAVIAKAKHQE